MALRGVWYVFCPFPLDSYTLGFSWVAANGVGVDRYGFEVPDEGLPDSDALLWYCECGCEWAGHAEVSIEQSFPDFEFHSSNEIQLCRPLGLAEHRG